MVFTVPSFPLPVDVYSGPWISRSLRLSTEGNLAPGRRVYTLPAGNDPGSFIATIAMYLLVPAFTDVRDMSCGGVHPDVIECPAGSGRWYGVMVVDDAGKGFANEHRVVIMTKIFQTLNGTDYNGLVWPSPIP